MFSIPPTAKFGTWAMAAMVLGLIVQTWQLQVAAAGEKCLRHSRRTDLRLSLILHISHLGARFQEEVVT